MLDEELNVNEANGLPPDDNFVFRDEESKEPFNWDKAEAAFSRSDLGRDVLKDLQENQQNFRGDWFRLGLLLWNVKKDMKNSTEDSQPATEERLQTWNAWRGGTLLDEDYDSFGGNDNAFLHLENANLRKARLQNANFREAYLQNADLGSAHLEKANLQGARLEKAKLPRTRLQNADLAYVCLYNARLFETHLEGANLLGARLEHAKLWQARLEKATLMGARLENTDLQKAHLEEANLHGAHLEDANLFETRLKDANLKAAYLENANLPCARLERAKLQGARLEKANLFEARLQKTALRSANLDGADVRSTEGLLFDDNRVSRTRIEGNAKDPWSVLRRSYTGPWFFVHLLLLIAFFTPYIARAALLTLASRGYDLAEGRLPQQLESATDTVSAISMLSGWHDGPFWFGMAVTVLLYNALRVVLTLRITSLRDAEERSMVTPTKEEYLGDKNAPWYRVDRRIGLFQIHKKARVLAYAAGAFALFNLGHWTWTTQVPVAFDPKPAQQQTTKSDPEQTKPPSDSAED